MLPTETPDCLEVSDVDLVFGKRPELAFRRAVVGLAHQLRELGDGDEGEHPDDGDDDHQLDQREPALARAPRAHAPAPGLRAGALSRARARALTSSPAVQSVRM